MYYSSRSEPLSSRGLGEGGSVGGDGLGVGVEGGWGRQTRQY